MRRLYLALLLLCGVGGLVAMQEHAKELTDQERIALTEKAKELITKATKLYETGRHQEATTLLEDALKIQQTLYPTAQFLNGHTAVADNLHQLAVVSWGQRKFAAAEGYYRQAIAMRQKLYSADKYPQGHADLAMSMNNLGYVLEEQGKYADAEKWYLEERVSHRRDSLPFQLVFLFLLLAFQREEERY